MKGFTHDEILAREPELRNAAACVLDFLHNPNLNGRISADKRTFQSKVSAPGGPRLRARRVGFRRLRL
jgi:hypothetical protein